MTAPIAVSQQGFLARCAARGNGRDRVIDIARGIALAAILNTHFSLIARAIGSLGGFRAPLLADVQYPDFAEFFVFLSGYVYGLVYGARLQRDGLPVVLRQTLRRMSQIFRAMVVTIVIAVGLSWLLVADANLLRALDIMPFESSGRQALFDLVTFRSSPLFINILCLYVMLLAAGPAFILGFRRSVLVTFGVSLAVWLTVQAGLLHLETAWGGISSFNPLAWQLLFAMGIFLGMQRGFDTLIAGLSRRAMLMLGGACLFFLALRTGVRVSPELYALLAPFSSKPDFALLRAANFVCLAPVFVLFVAWADRALPAVMGWFARVGALSLEMFCAGVLLTLLMGVAFLGLGGGIAAYVAVLSAGLVLYVLSVKAMETLS